MVWLPALLLCHGLQFGKASQAVENVSPQSFATVAQDRRRLAFAVWFHDTLDGMLHQLQTL